MIDLIDIDAHMVCMSASDMLGGSLGVLINCDGRRRACAMVAAKVVHRQADTFALPYNRNNSGGDDDDVDDKRIRDTGSCVRVRVVLTRALRHRPTAGDRRRRS